MTRPPESVIIQSQAEGRRTRVMKREVYAAGYEIVTNYSKRKAEKMKKLLTNAPGCDIIVSESRGQGL